MSPNANKRAVLAPQPTYSYIILQVKIFCFRSPKDGVGEEVDCM